MNVLYFLVPIAVGLAGLGVLGFRWAVRSGQFDDLETPAISLFTEPDTIDRSNNAADPHEKHG